MKNTQEIIKSKALSRFIKELNIPSFKEKNNIFVNENTEKNKDILENKFFTQENKNQKGEHSIMLDFKYVNEKRVNTAVKKLVSKYFDRSAIELVQSYIVDDLAKYKQYEHLNAHEMLTALINSCDRLDQELCEDEYDDLLTFFSSLGMEEDQEDQEEKEVLKNFKNKALNNFYKIIKKFTELDVVEKDGHYVAIGETKKHRKILQACFFTFNNRHEEWRFTEFRQQNYFADLKLKELQAETGVYFKF